MGNSGSSAGGNSLASIGLQAYSTLLQAQGTATADQYQAEKLENAAKYGPPGGPIPPASPSAGNIPLQETVAGSAAWVDSTSHRTLYFLDVDTATGGVCTGSCLNIWPVAAPSSGAQTQGNITIITRSDGTGSQWAYQGHPLYFFSGDSGPDQANGEGIAQAGGHWHVSRPSSSSSSGGGGCTGNYC